MPETPATPARIRTSPSMERTVMPSPFQAGYMDSERMLRYEVGRLDGKQLIVQLAIREMDLKVDGRPKLRAEYEHPGVIVSFESKHGPLRYATDAFDHWHASCFGRKEVTEGDYAPRAGRLH